MGTGSWLGRAFHGQGYGTEMRAAVLDLAFDGLGAEYATSEAFEDNVASYGVSRKLGYVDDGVERHVVRGKPVVGRRLRLDRAGWAAARRVPVTVAGLEPCLPMFGLARVRLIRRHSSRHPSRSGGCRLAGHLRQPIATGRGDLCHSHPVGCLRPW